MNKRIRREIAAQCLQGILAGPTCLLDADPNKVAARAIHFADALLCRLGTPYQEPLTNRQLDEHFRHYWFYLSEQSAVDALDSAEYRSAFSMWAHDGRPFDVVEYIMGLMPENNPE